MALLILSQYIAIRKFMKIDLDKKSTDPEKIWIRDKIQVFNSDGNILF